MTYEEMLELAAEIARTEGIAMDDAEMKLAELIWRSQN